MEPINRKSYKEDKLSQISYRKCKSKNTKRKEGKKESWVSSNEGVKMAGNFSKEQIKNVTFNELNMMIDQWIAETQEIKNVFLLQHDELKRLMFGICLYERVILAKCFQDNIDQNISYTYNRQKNIEQMVTKLEAALESSCKCKTYGDIYRENTYKIAENINSTYINFMEAFGELQNSTGQIKQKDRDPSNIEYIAQLLQNHLQQLEHIEMKIHDMRNQLNQTEYYKRHVLTLLHIKENTF